MVKAYFQMLAYDQDHSLVRKSRKRRSRSFVQGFLKFHFGMLQDGDTLTVTDTAGASRTLSNNTPDFRISSPGRGGGGINYLGSSYISSTESGIVVGTGTTAVTPQDYQLATLIADGTSAGTLEYFCSAGIGLTVSHPTGSFNIERLWRNSSSGTITVNEVGIYSVMTVSGANYGVCILRDLVSPAFSVLNGEYMRIIYTISVTV